MSWRKIVAAAYLVPVLLAPAQAAILEDFPFNEPAGTLIENTVSAVGTGQVWSVDADLDGVTTNGLGQYNASLKSNVDFGGTLLPVVPKLVAGPVYGVLELTYDFDPLTLDTAENEEIRLSFVNSGTSTVTAEIEIERNDDNEVVIFGTALGSGASGTSQAKLGLSQTTKMIAVLSAHLGADTMNVFYSLDGGTSFAMVPGEGVLNADRGIESLRIVLNNDLSQDSVLIDRVYLATSNPFPGLIPDAVPEPASLMLGGVLCLGATGVRRRRG